MNTAILNVRTDKKIKSQAMKVASNLGFSLSTLVNAYLRNLIRTKRVQFADDVELEPTPYLIRQIKKAEKEYKEGNVSPAFTNAHDALAWLNNPKRKYVRDI
jgi:addiction module RelB/DinJ family antitoxin